MLERDGKVLATTGPVKPSDARLRRSQSLAHESGIALKIAKELIIEKLSAQDRVISTYFKHSSSSQVIVDARKLVVTAKSNEEIRRWEAKGAKACWGAM
jgi:CRISPR/Cas system-associated endonuclease Cas1